MAFLSGIDLRKESERAMPTANRFSQLEAIVRRSLAHFGLRGWRRMGQELECSP